jgi:hypothetical protein
MTLAINSIKCDTVATNCEAISQTALENGRWKQIIRQWEEIFNLDDFNIRSQLGELPPIADFFWTLLKGVCKSPSPLPGLLLRTVLFEK